MNNDDMKNGWVILTKSDCVYCERVKCLLTGFKYHAINCDEYLKEPEKRKEFLAYIKNRIGRSYEYFPMVFYNYLFIGGYNETKEFLLSNIFINDDF